MSSIEGRWGDDVRISVVREHIGLGSEWTHCEDAHVIIAHLDGPIRGVETQVEGVAVAAPPLGPDHVHLVPAGSRYGAQARGGLVRFADLRVAPGALRETIGDDVVGRGGVRLVRRDAFLYRSIERLAELTGRTDDVSQMAGHAISHALLLHLHETYGDARAGDEAAALTEGAARDLQAYIRANLGGAIALSALTDLAGLSTNQLLVAFRRRFGTTPAQYVIAERLRRVRWLLTHTAYDISTIALATGFASHSHLATTFRRHVGVTPQAFRRTFK
jgi:AraC family transcriptional regulator